MKQAILVHFYNNPKKKVFRFPGTTVKIAIVVHVFLLVSEMYGEYNVHGCSKKPKY